MCGIGRAGIWHKKYCKNQLSQMLEFSKSRGPFFMILGGLGTIFMTFVALETGLTFDDFSEDSCVTPDPATILVGG